MWLNDELEGKEFLLGDKFTVADITAMAVFKMQGQTKVDIAPELTNLQSWVDRISARPSANA